MAELTRDVAEYLISQGLVEAIGIDVFLDFTPDTPDDIVIISEYNGPPTATGIKSIDRRLQLKIRNKSYPVARKNAWGIFNVIDQPEDRIMQFTLERWAVAWARQTPALLERDDKGRSVFVFNVGITTYRD